MAITFTKTTWVDLSSPYIDASQLNRIETVLDALVNGASRAVWRDGDTMTGALTLSAGNLNVGAGAIQTAGVTRISNGGAGTLTTLSTTGLADLASARVQSLAASQMVATDANDNLVSWDAATARTNLGITGAQRIDRSLKSDGSGPGWLKLATLKVTAQNHACSAAVDVVSAGRYLASDRAICRLYVRIRQTSAMSAPLDIKDVRYIQQGGISPSAYAPTFGYVVVQDDASAKVVDVYVATTNLSDRLRYTVMGSFSDLTVNAPVFYEDPTLQTTLPAGHVAGLREDLAVDILSAASIKATDQAGTGNRLTQAAADGTQSASIPVPTAFIQTLLDDANAATARATLGVDGVVALWRDQARTFTPSGGTQSLLVASSTARKIVAGTWKVGMSVELDYEAEVVSGATSNQIQYYLGPDGTFTGPYYIGTWSFTLASGGTYYIKGRFLLTCLTTGASGTFRASFSGELYSGAGGGTLVSQFKTSYTTFTADTTVDRFLDLTAGGWGSSPNVYGIASSAIARNS